MASGRLGNYLSLFFAALFATIFPAFGQSSQPNKSLVKVDSIVVVDAYGTRKRVILQPFIHLPAHQNYLSIYYSAPAFSSINYRLTGLDDDWLTTPSGSVIHYANLKGGQYIFELKTENAGLVRYQIQIDIPFWQRIWFWPLILLYLLLLGGVILYLFLLYRFQQKLRILQTRDRIARDLHDDMGSSLSSISILSQTAQLSVVKDPERARQTLERIGETARQIMDSMGDIIWSVNPQQDAVINVIHRISAIADDLFEATDTSYQIDADSALHTFPLSLEQRRELILICKEALANAAKYAKASHVQIQLKRVNKWLDVTISDDGQGFDTAIPAKREGRLGGNGLSNMANRAQKLGGKLTINAHPGQGTAIFLKIPL